MAYEDIRNKFLPLLQRTQGIGSLGQQDPRFANAMNIAKQGAQYRAGLDKQLGRDLGTMRTGAALQIASPAIGLINPVAGGAAFGAGNQMMGLKSGGQIAGGAAIGGATAGMLNKAISGLQASPIAQNMRASLSQSMSNRVTPISNSIEQRITPNAFNGKPMTRSPAVQEAYLKKFGASPDMTSINYNNPNAYTRAGVRGHYDNSPTPVDFTKSYQQATPNNFTSQSPRNNVNMYRTSNIQNQAQAQTQAPNFVQGQVTNNFSNTTPGNTVIQPAFKMTPQQAQTSANFDRLLGGQAVNPNPSTQQPLLVQGMNSSPYPTNMPLPSQTNGVGLGSFNINPEMDSVVRNIPQGIPNIMENMSGGAAPINMSGVRAAGNFMDDLNSSLMNQFGSNISPMGGTGSVGNFINRW